VSSIMKINVAAILLFSMNASVSIAQKADKKLTPRRPADLPGIYNGGKKAKVILALSTDYPPYATLDDRLRLSGFGPDFARNLKTVCKISVVLMQTDWSNCWGSDKIGPGLSNAEFHGCATYTNTKGVRNRYLEFTKPILDMNKAAGILTRLENGVPVVNGLSSLDGVSVGDVNGWAPTSDVLATSKNLCTGKVFEGFNLVPNTPKAGRENDAALQQLLNKEVDALWIYADQAETYKSACNEDSNQDDWDCEMWSRFGTDFAYIQTGIYDYMNSGTTLAISKKGSGLAETLDPCIDAYTGTKSYYNLCKTYNLEDDCIRNEFFPPINEEKVKDYSKPTNELSGNCDGGYCPCPEA